MKSEQKAVLLVLMCGLMLLSLAYSGYQSATYTFGIDLMNFEWWRPFVFTVQEQFLIFRYVIPLALLCGAWWTILLPGGQNESPAKDSFLEQYVIITLLLLGAFGYGAYKSTQDGIEYDNYVACLYNRERIAESLKTMAAGGLGAPELKPMTPDPIFPSFQESVERYSYPKDLSKLVPSYLHAIPTCPSARKDTYSEPYRDSDWHRRRDSPFANTMIHCSGDHRIGERLWRKSRSGS